MSKLHQAFALIFLVSSLTFPIKSFAQEPTQKRRNQQFGEVAIDTSGSDKKDSYGTQQSEALSYAQSVASSSKGSGTSVNSINQGGLFYLAGLYLYCSAKSGACPFILDTILTGEYLNSRGQEKKTCPKMKLFWELWVKNGFEERLPYLVPIGSVSAMKSFNDFKRNSYIKCETTLSTFKVDDTISRNLALTAKLIEQVQAKKLNIFHETGAQTAAKSGDKSIN